MSFELGSAHGKIIIDASGAKSGVNEAKGALNSLTGVAAGVMAGIATAVAAGGVLMAGALTAVTVQSTRMAADMEANMSAIQSVMGASAEEIAQLKDLVFDLGLDPNLKVTAEEAAQAIEMLGKNGLTTTEILEGAAEATVQLANATGAQFGTAADVATDVMALFNIEADNMAEAINAITGVVVNSKFTIDDFALALAQGGGVAAQMGISLADFTTVIAAISPAFASGSDAGTSFKTMLQRLAAPTDKAIDALKELGLYTEEAGSAFFDAEGNMVSMAEVAGLLQGALADLTVEQQAHALTTIFGADAVRAASALAATGAEDFRALQEAIEGTSAADAAATRVDNLRGSLDILGGILDTVKLKIGEAFIPLVRSLVDTLSEFISNNQDKVIGFFENLVAVIEAFASGSPGDFPWEDLFPPWLAERMYDISEIFEGLRDIVIGFVEGTVGLDTPWEDFLPPWAADVAYAIGDAIEFVRDHAEAFKGALQGIAVLLAGAGIAALIAGIASAISALMSPVTLLIAGAALLGAAWRENWGGIRDKVQEAWDAIQPVVQGIMDFVADLQAGGDRAEGAINKIKDALGPLTPLLESAWEAVKDLVDQLKSFGQSEGNKIGAWFEENEELIRAFAKVIQDTLGMAIGLYVAYSAIFVREVARMWAFVGPALSGIIDLVLGFAEVIMKLATGDTAGAWEALQEVGRNAIEALKAILIGFVDWVTGWFGTSFEGLVETWRGNWELMKETVSLVWENIKTAIAERIEAIKTAIQERLEFIRAVFVTAWAMIRAAILVKIAEIKAGIMEFITGLQESITAGMERVRTILTDVWEGIKSAVLARLRSMFAAMGLDFDEMASRWANIWSDIQLIAQTIMDRVRNAITTKLEEIKTTITTKIEEVKTVWTDRWNQIISTVTTIWNDITTQISNKAEQIRTTVADKIEAVRTAWNEKWEAIVETVTDIWNNIVEGIQERAEDIKEKVGEMLEEAQRRAEEFFTPFLEYGRELIERIIEGFQEKANAVTEKVLEIINAAKEAINGVIGQFVAIGSAIISGIQEGMSGAIGGFISYVTGIVESVIDGVLGILGISSPSKVFMEIGAQIVEGLIVGMSGGEEDLEDTAQGLAEIISISLSEGLKDLLDLGDGISGFLGDVMSRYEKEYLDPLMEQMETADQQVQAALKNFAQSVGEDSLDLEDLNWYYLHGTEQQKQQIRAIWQWQNRRNEAESEYLDQQEYLLELQRQQEQLEFLRQQMDLLDLLAEHGLNAADILDGITLGLDASLPDLLAAMEAAMQAIIEQANQELQVGSPSRVFKKMFEWVVAGAAEGLRNIRPLERAASRMVRGLKDVTEHALSVEMANNLSLANTPNFTLNPVLHGPRPVTIMGDLVIPGDADRYGQPFDVMEYIDRIQTEY